MQETIRIRFCVLMAAMLMSVWISPSVVAADDNGLEYYSTPVVATCNHFTNPEFIDFNDQGALLVNNYREGHMYESRGFVWRSNVSQKILVPESMGSAHETRLVDMNNVGDVLLKVNYVGKVDPLTVKPQVLDKVYIRYANGTLRQVATPDWACPDCIWPEKIDDTATVYGYLKQDHAFDESISFS